MKKLALLFKRSAAFKRLFDQKDEDARIVLEWLAEISCFSKTTHGNDIQEGRRQVVLEILKLSKVDPNVLYANLIKQAKEEAMETIDSNTNPIIGDFN